MVGPTSQQDVELSALYRDSVITYGEGKVLGILATKTDDHEIQKRAVPDEPQPQEISTTTQTPEIEQSNQTDFIFYPDKSTYKILLYTSTAPRLFDGTNITTLNANVPTTITTNRRSDQCALKVQYNYKDDKVSVFFSTVFFFKFSG